VSKNDEFILLNKNVELDLVIY